MESHWGSCEVPIQALVRRPQVMALLLTSKPPVSVLSKASSQDMSDTAIEPHAHAQGIFYHPLASWAGDRCSDSAALCVHFSP